MGKYNIVDCEKFVYLQLSNGLMHGAHYKDVLKSDNLILCMLFMDRLSLNIKNNWVDEDGDVYFVFENKTLVDLLNVSELALAPVAISMDG